MSFCSKVDKCQKIRSNRSEQKRKCDQIATVASWRNIFWVIYSSRNAECFWPAGHGVLYTTTRKPLKL